MSDEKAIVTDFKAGDAGAFDTIYHKYSKKLYHFALGLLKDPEVASELVQDVFVSLWEKRDQIDTSYSFENYLFTIAYNSIRKFFRKRSMENKVREYLQNNNKQIIDNIDSTLIYNELYELASKTIEKLPPKRKLVYTLNKQEGIKIKEIAKKLNISTRTAENHLAKALKFLKKELGEISMLTLLFYYLFIS